MVDIFVVNSFFPLTLTCERSNVVFKSIFFLSHIKSIFIITHKNSDKITTNSKSVDMLKYKFHFKHLESRPELHFSDLTIIWQYKT
jgi:hypothetical protein